MDACCRHKDEEVVELERGTNNPRWRVSPVQRHVSFDTANARLPTLDVPPRHSGPSSTILKWSSFEREEDLSITLCMRGSVEHLNKHEIEADFQYFGEYSDDSLWDEEVRFYETSKEVWYRHLSFRSVGEGESLEDETDEGIGLKDRPITFIEAITDLNKRHDW